MSLEQSLAGLKETEGGGSFSLQNSKMLKVELADATVQAKLGSMVAHQGDVKFEHAGSGGMGRFMKKAMTGEGTDLMKVRGTGEVFLADFGQEIQLLRLDNEAITANGANVLAFEDGIDWDIKRVEGVSGMLGGGLYNMHLSGTGFVAIISDGPPVLLEVDGETDLRRSAGGDHLVERADLVGQGRRQHEDADRPRLRRDGPAQLLGQGLAPDPALGRTRHLDGGRRQRLERRRCGRPRQAARRLSPARRGRRAMSGPTKYVLDEERIPTHWVNLMPDLPGEPLPPLSPATMEPAGPPDLAPIFPMALIEQEVSAEPEIEIPDEVREIYSLWRPTPLFRARRLEKALGTPAHIYYKYEGVSPAGSHKPNSAVPQAYYNREAGIRKLVTETGAGQWGSSAGARLQAVRPRVRGLHGRGQLRPEAVPAGDDRDLGRDRSTAAPRS